MLPIDVSPTNLDTVRQILRQHVPELEVRVFGSRVGWTARETSDLDLALMTDEPLPIGQMVVLKAAFTKSNLPFRVDIVDWVSTSESFQKVIEREYVVLVTVDGDPVESRGSSVPGEWINCQLEECMATIIDYRGKTPRKTSSGIPLITAKVVKGGRIKKPTEFIAIEDYDSWMRRGIPQSGDVLITTEAPLGEVAQLCQQRVALAQRLILLRGKSEVLDNRFLKFLMQSAPVQDQLRARATGTTVLGIKQKELRQIELVLPPIHGQRAIAHILGTLDDKIELNRRMNETLEAMARALFKSWFVDFDPVRAKMEGRDPGLPGHLADLFPDRLVESDLGEIPEGWAVKPFAETVEIIGGGTPKTSVPEYWDGDIPWFSVVDAPAHSDVWVIDTTKKCTRMGIKNSSARILPVETTIISARGTVGRIALVGVPMAMNQSCYGLRRSGSKHGLFNYFTIRALVVLLQQRTHGSVFDTITRDTLAAVYVVSPCPDIIDAYEGRVRPALERIRAGFFQSRNLVTLRDTLLPKLIAGELRVEGANVNC